MWVFHHTALLWEDLALSHRHPSPNCFSLLAFLISPASLGEFFCHIISLKWSLIFQTFFFSVLKRSFTKPLSWYPVMKKDVEVAWSRHMSKQRPWEAIAYLKDPFVTGSLVPSGVTSHATVTPGVEESGAGELLPGGQNMERRGRRSLLPLVSMLTGDPCAQLSLHFTCNSDSYWRSLWNTEAVNVEKYGFCGGHNFPISREDYSHPSVSTKTF